MQVAGQQATAQIGANADIQRTDMQNQSAQAMQNKALAAEDRARADQIREGQRSEKAMILQQQEAMKFQAQQEEADRQFNLAVKKGDYALADKMDQRRNSANMSVGILEAINGTMIWKSTQAAIRQATGKEEATARLDKANATISQTVDTAKAVSETQKGLAEEFVSRHPDYTTLGNIKNVPAEKLASPENAGSLDRVVADTSARLGVPFSLSLTEDPNKFEEWLVSSTPQQIMDARNLVGIMKAKISGQEKDLSKVDVTRTDWPNGRQFDAAPEWGGKRVQPPKTTITAPSQSKWANENYMRLDSADKMFDKYKDSKRELTGDTTKLFGTVGKMMKTIEASRMGYTPAVIPGIASQLYGSDPNMAEHVTDQTLQGLGPVMDLWLNNPSLLPEHKAMIQSYGPLMMSLMSEPTNNGMANRIAPERSPGQPITGPTRNPYGADDLESMSR
jgi:hypothetical protein